MPEPRGKQMWKREAFEMMELLWDRHVDFAVDMCRVVVGGGLDISDIPLSKVAEILTPREGDTPGFC